MNILERLERLLKMVEEYKPQLLERQDFQHWVMFFKVVSDERLYTIFEQTILTDLHQVMIHPLMGPTEKDLQFPTGLHLGTTIDNQAVFLPPMLLARNVLVSGETGSGKTNTLKYLARQLPHHRVRVWVFDFKNEYRDLESKGYTIIPWTELKFNPLNMLDPTDVTKNAKIFQRIFGHSQGLWLASQAFLGAHLHRLYTIFGSFAHTKFPSLFELAEQIYNAKVPRFSPEADYKQRLLNRLIDILQWEGHIFDCEQGFPIADLIHSNIIFEMRGMKPQTTAFLTECFMASLYEYWVARGPQNKLHNVIISDEAKHIFDIRKQYRLKDERPYVDEILAETRAFGIGIILADQQPSELTPSVEANSHIKIEMQLGSGREIHQMNRAMGLTERQSKQSYKIGLGEAIVKISGRPPFKVKIPACQ
jgi:energy-coupling factor transporter ATP-binding protein EcfA2